MHGHGKSDGCVVPAKLPNNAARAVAEVVEGRRPVKGNTDRPTRTGHSAGQRVPNGLDRVREAARRDKQARFTALLHHVDLARLAAAYSGINPKAAPGVDQVTWDAYGQNLRGNLEDLLRSVHSGAYRASPSRRVYIPKPDGRQRPLGIAVLEDKILQRAVVEVLNAVCEVDFRGFSYGFRPRRGPHDALAALAVGIGRKKVNWVLAARNRAARGQGKPETFDFLGFTHICARSKNGRFWLKRITISKRMRAKLREVKDQLKLRMHEPIPVQGRWLRSVLQGHFAYYAVPGNSDAVAAFRDHVTRHWFKALRRRSQRTRVTWERMNRLAKRWIPPAHVKHPFPEVRFAART